jgi:tetratricopeptide (TPR) repeat protein
VGDAGVSRRRGAPRRGDVAGAALKPAALLALPEVTLLVADTANHALAARALARSIAGIRFARAVWLTDAVPAGVAVPDGVDVVRIAPIASRHAYSALMLKGLAPHVMTSHVLVAQWDGFVLHPDAWEPGFLDCDYLGARWFWHTDGMDVGNGGFSLRSRRLVEALADPRIDGDAAEDELLARTFRPLLEREHGIRFGDGAMADRFAFEVAHTARPTFGFHGLYNFARVLPAAEIAALAPLLSDDVARSPQCAQLLRNAQALRQWPAVAALSQRILAAMPGDAEAKAALGNAARHASPYAGVGRNDPCPCGSGKRFKHCHGREGAPVEAIASPAAPDVEAAPAAPASADTLTERALAAHRRGAIDEAVRGYRAALAIDPEAPTPMHFLGVAHYQRGRFAEALPLVERSRARRPQEAEFHNNAGLLYTALDRIDDAVAAYRDALAQRPDHVTALNNLGLALAQRNDLDGAIDAYRRARAVAPDFAEARWNLAIALLARGDFAEGWREYDARLDLTPLAGAPWRAIHPRYAGEPLAGRTLLLRAEQGLGDALQFIRYAQDFAARGARVVVQVPDPLVALCATAPGAAASVGASAPAPDADFELPLLSVGAVLGLDAASIARATPYLAADPARVAHWRAIVRARPARLHAGLSWAGNPQHANDRRRSVALARLAPLLALEDVAWYSLQHVDGEAEVAGVPEASRLVELEARHDFDDKAALVSALDVVVSVDTSNAHLAGALDVPLCLMLPHAADWRWGVATTTTAWYPSARLYRQPVAGDWRSPVAAIADALVRGDLPGRGLTGSGRAPREGAPR